MPNGSTENLIPNEKDAEKGGSDLDYNIAESEESVLNETEKRYLLAAEWGDTAGVKKIFDEFKGKEHEFNRNCKDPLNRSALVTAIENENFELIQLLLESGVEVGDGLLHAISEEYVEGVEELLQWEEDHHKDGTPYSWESFDRSKSSFTADMTPLILAAHRNNFEILKMLLDRGATLPMPHDVKCGCDECIRSQESDSLRHSISRINAFKALSASSLIVLSSRDPLLTAFELSWELKRLQVMESEFRAEYAEMRSQVQEFATAMLDHVRTSNELEIMLNFNHELTSELWTPGQRQTLARLKLALKYKQKGFVAHPNVQQLLASIWYDGLPGFRRKSRLQQVTQVISLGCSFPLYSMAFIMAPNSEKGLLMKKPFVQFIMHSTSYMFFLTLLAGASLRIIELLFEVIALPWMVDFLDEWRKFERGSLPGPIELGIIMYVSSQIFGELKSLWEDGLFEYISDLWNIVDFISNSFYVTWIMMRTVSWIIVHRDLWYRNINPYFPRENWHPFDPMLLAEGAFAAAMIFSFLKLVHIFSINPHLGPLQVSLGRMIIDILKFFFIYTLVLFAFGCGFNQLLMYYAEAEKRKCYHLHPDVADFDDQEKACTIWRRFANLFETSQSLFWASFGLVDLVSFELAGIKGFTRFWALLMFGSYSVINIIVLLNMLIAMMSNSYQVIYEKADTEWKFARSHLWMSYFDDGGVLPPPFNMCPTLEFVQGMLGKSEKQKRTKSVMRKSLEKVVALHDRVMKLLVKRYVTAEQSKRDDTSVTEDDIIEVRADISSFRFELLDILQANKMSVPNFDKSSGPSGAAKRKTKEMERRIMKDFQIGFVENLVGEMEKADGGVDVFSSIAKVVGKKRKESIKKDKTGKRNWNEIVKENFMSGDPIGKNKNTVLRRDVGKLRKDVLTEKSKGLQMDTDIIVQYNPRLSREAPATRVAYIKFMEKKLMKLDEEGSTEDPTVSDPKPDPAKPGSSAPAKPGAPEPAKAGAPPPPAKAGEKPPPPPGATGAQKAAPPPAPGAPPKKAEPPKPQDQKPAAPKAEPPKSDSKKPDAKADQPKTEPPKPSAPTGDPPKADTSKPSAAGDAKKAADAPKAAADKPADKPANKPADKPKQAASTAETRKEDARINMAQNTAASGATGDRGKSTVTGRMISGWL